MPITPDSTNEEVVKHFDEQAIAHRKAAINAISRGAPFEAAAEALLAIEARITWMGAMVTDVYVNADILREEANQ